MMLHSWLKNLKARLGHAAPRRSRRKGYRPMLESLEDRCLLSTFTVLNTTDGGAGSLRQAIVDANATANAGGLPDRIEFNIPGPDTVVKTINVGTTALPVITDPVVIDGYTQPGSRENTNTVESRLGLSTVLRIELKGAGSDVHFGLNIQAGNSTVQGLVINGFVSCGILLSPNGGNVIEGNFIGTDAGGSVRRGPGVGVSITSSGNTIGGTTPAARNLISGHASNAVTIDAINAAVNNVVQGNLIGIDVTGTLTLRNGGGVVIARPLASGNRIGGTEVGAGNVISGNGSAVAIGNAGPGNLVQGNFIGTDVTGTLALPNGGAGGSPAVSVSNSPGTVIGGDDADDGLLDGIVRARNVISGNAATGFFGVGAVTFFDSLGSRVQGNFIGTDVTGAAPLGNGEAGIGIRGSVGTMIGGTTSGAGNVIAFNGSNGVVHVLTGGGNTGHAILGNSIFSNGGLGIDLGNLMGVTPNDPGDADTGPNNLQNFPVLNGATSTTTATTIRGTLNSKPFGIYLLQFFASDNADPSGHGEGQTFLGQTTVTTDNNGDARDVAGNLGFTAVLLGVTVPPTRFFTATATDVALFDHDGNPFTPEVVRNDTSEFSRSINAGVFQLNGPAYFVAENGGAVQITVLRAPGSFGVVSVDFTTSNGTAQAGSDYTTATQTLAFADGETSKVVSIPILDDTHFEGNETVALMLSNATGGAALGAQASATLFITENEPNSPGSLQFSAAAYTVAEDGGLMTITVTRTGGNAGAVSASYSTQNDSAIAGADFDTDVLGSLQWADGDMAAKTFVVPIFDDNDVEGDEQLQLHISSPLGGATLGSPSLAVLTITDNDVAQPVQVQFSAASFTAAENGVLAAITVTRSGDSSGMATVDLATSDGTASAGSDYRPTLQQVTFLPDVITRTVFIDVFDDETTEPFETIQLTLSNPTDGVTLGTPSTANLVILDNDRGQIFVTPRTGLSTTEAGGTAVFTVVLSGLPQAGVTVALNSSDLGEGTVSPSLLTFTPANGTTPQFVVVTGIDDFVSDGDVAYTIVLGPAATSDPSFAGVNPDDVAVTNADDDALPILSSEISGQKFEDTNGDGVHDANEPGLNGFMIELVDAATGEVRATQVTRGIDLNQDGQIDPATEQGVYRFESVRPGDFEVREVQQLAYVQTQPLGTTEKLPTNAPTDGHSFTPALTPDGRFVAFSSFATNLVPNDTNGQSDIFVLDRNTGAVERISVSMTGAQANGASFDAVISADGQVIAYRSLANNLLPGDTNNASDIFVYNRRTHVVRRVSAALSGQQGNADSFAPTLSGDGRIVAFQSTASNLVGGDTNGVGDIFTVDLATGLIKRVNVFSPLPGTPGRGVGGEGDRPSDQPSLSADGRFVAFTTASTYTDSGDTNNAMDVFVFDRQLGTLERIATPTVQGNGDSYHPVLSGDGKLVAFVSDANNLVAGDTNGEADIFVFDRQAKTFQRISVTTDAEESAGPSVAPALSADGRFVTFVSFASLVENDQNGLPDVYLRDRLLGYTERISAAREVGDADLDSLDPAVSADGRHVVFASHATNLSGLDDNGWTDIFVKDRAGVHAVTVTSGDHRTGLDFGNFFALSDVAGQIFDDLDADGTRDPNEPGQNGKEVLLIDSVSGAVAARQFAHDIDLNFDGAIDPLTERGRYRFQVVQPGSYRVHIISLTDPAYPLPQPTLPTFADALDTHPQATRAFRIVTGDLDGDGDLDIVLSNNDGALELLANENGAIVSRGVFAPKVSPSDVKIADLDGDGKAEIIETTLLDKFTTLHWGFHRNLGNFQFDAFQDFPTTISTPRSSIAADLDGDGDLDLAGLNAPEDKVVFLRNDGGFNFVAANFIKVEGPTLMAALDYNADGRQDLAIYARGSNNVQIFANNGDIGFAPLQIASVGTPALDSIVAGDFDGDGDPDLALAGGKSDGRAILLRNQGATKVLKVETIASTGIQTPRDLVAADLDLDGDLDLALTAQGPSRGGISFFVSLLVNNGTGSFAAQRFQSTFANPYSDVVAADINGDGAVDLLVADSGINAQSVVRSLAVFPNRIHAGDRFQAVRGQHITATDFGTFTKANLSGNVFDDKNGDGDRADTDPGLVNQTVFLDLNGNGTPGPGEPTAKTDGKGQYSFSGLTPGTFTIRTVLPAGFVATSAVSPSITVVSGEVRQNVHFGQFKTFTITGTIFDDTNGNGVRLGSEPGLANRTVTLDLGGNRTRQAITNSTGAFTFANVGPNALSLRQLTPTGFLATAGVNGYAIAPVSGVNVEKQLFGTFKLTAILGQVFNDINSDGVKNPFDAILNGRQVFLDVIHNGRLDAGEPVVTTILGNYQFTNLGPGPHIVDSVPLPGWVQSGPSRHDVSLASGVQAAGRNFGHFELPKIISGSIDGIGPGAAAANVTVYIDNNDNGRLDSGEASYKTNGEFAFTAPRLAFRETVMVRLQMPPGYRMDSGNSFQLLSGPIAFDTELTPFTIRPAAFFPFDDQFERANSPILGNDWLEVAGELSINSNKLGGSPRSIAVVNSLPVADVRLNVVVSNNPFPVHAGLVARYQLATGDYYLGLLKKRSTGAIAEIHRVVGGVTTVLGAMQTADREGSLEFQIIGEQLTLRLNGKELVYVTDSTLAPGLVGVFIGPNNVLDGFSANLNTNPGINVEQFPRIVSGLVSDESFPGADRGAANVTVYIDNNNNGRLDPGEPSYKTNGPFAFTQPSLVGASNSFVVRLQLPPGYRMDHDVSFHQKTPGGGNTNLGAFNIRPEEYFTFVDFFDRANSTIVGDDWLEVAGNLSISANKLAGSPSSIAVVNSLPVADVQLKVNVSNNSTSVNAGLVARYQLATGDHYVGLLKRKPVGAIAEIHRVVGGVTTVLGAMTTNDREGRLEFTIVGQQLTLRLDGAALVYVTDATLAEPGQVGVFVGPNNVLTGFFATESPNPDINVEQFPKIVSGNVSDFSFPFIENGAVNVTLFIDNNNNGRLDAGEASYKTNGDFAFSLPSALGFHESLVLRLQLPLGYRMASGASSRIINGPIGTIGPFESFKIERVESSNLADSFIRANSTDLGDDWREVAGNLSIRANTLSGDATPNIAVVNHPPVANVLLEVNVISGFLPVNSGLVARYQDTTGDHYVGLLVQRGSKVFAEIQRVVAGVTTVLGAVEFNDAGGRLEFEIVGAQLTLRLNDVLLVSLTDSTLVEPGLVGVFVGPRSRELIDFLSH